jgi:hypothetical protein
MNINWTRLSDTDRRTILEQTSVRTGYIVQAVEKDWWVTTVLEALFFLPFADQLSFKGGTSLSKCWGTIQRFSEDIDIAINREFLGFSGELTNKQIRKGLRKKLCSYVRTDLKVIVENKLLEMGIPRDWFTVTVNETENSTVDPESIYVNFTPLFPVVDYLPASVKIEVSGRSMTEPVVNTSIKTMVAEQFPTAPYADTAFNVSAVAQKRTFLEKAFLLHELLNQPGPINVDRRSRHLYDLEKMMGSQVETDALADTTLYHDIIEHRRKFIGLGGFNYETLHPQTLNFIPSEEQAAVWEADYRSMQTNMIPGESKSYPELIKRLTELNSRFRTIDVENE